MENEQTNLNRHYSEVREISTGLYRVCIVSDKVDRYSSIIDPEGMKTPVAQVVIDYAHNRITTGARLIATEIVVEEGVKKLYGTIEVQDTDEAFYLDSSRIRRSAGNLRAMLRKKHLQSVSVDFNPITTVKKRGGAETYTEWDLYALSFLAEIPGQAESGIEELRSLDNQSPNQVNQIMPKYEKDQAVQVMHTGIIIGSKTEGESVVYVVQTPTGNMECGEDVLSETRSVYDEPGNRPQAQPVESNPTSGDTGENVNDEMRKMCAEMREMYEDMKRTYGEMNAKRDAEITENEKRALKEADSVLKALDTNTIGEVKAKIEEPADPVSVNNQDEDLSKLQKQQLSKYRSERGLNLD